MNWRVQREISLKKLLIFLNPETQLEWWNSLNHLKISPCLFSCIILAGLSAKGHSFSFTADPKIWPFRTGMNNLFSSIIPAEPTIQMNDPLSCKLRNLFGFVFETGCTASVPWTQEFVLTQNSWFKSLFPFAASHFRRFSQFVNQYFNNHCSHLSNQLWFVSCSFSPNYIYF